MSPAALSQDEYFSNRVEAAYPAPAVDETKGLIAEAALRVYAKTADRLQPNRQRLHHYDRELKSVTHLSSSNRPHNGDGDASVSRQTDCNSISERAKDALKRRLRPHTTLSAYELAYTLRVSEGTIWNILRGSKSGPSGRVLFKLTEFFGGSFLNEVFSGPNVYCIDPRETRKLGHVQRIRELQAELEAMG
jgi:transcriptional regulator with XRE-family HTH domain